MPLKNKIKIEQFTADKLRPKDVPEVLRLAIMAQSNFGLTDTAAPSLFLNEIKNLIEESIEYFSAISFSTKRSKYYSI
jgi:hypothetical protein